MFFSDLQTYAPMCQQRAGKGGLKATKHECKKILDLKYFANVFFLFFFEEMAGFPF